MTTPETAATEASTSQEAADTTAPSTGPGREERGGRERRHGRDGRDARRGGGGRGDDRRGHRDHRDHRGPRLDLSPPHFNVDELAALAGPPLWQAVHAATVADVTEAAVFVDVQALGHAPVRAAVPAAELPGATVGAAVRVRLLDAPKAGEPVATASVAQARALDALDALLAQQSKGDGVPGYVVREVKGGYSVALCGRDEDDVAGAVRAFLPASQATLSRFGPRSGDDVVGDAGTFDLVELDPERANVVVTRKARLAAERKQQLVQRLADVKEGDVVTAVVKNIMPYGAFLDVGGLDGMVHQSDLTWDGRARAAEVLKIGARLQAKVISKNPETGKIKLGLKQLHQDPWAEVRSAFAEGSVVEGTIVALADFGAFVRLPVTSSQQPIEGLIHISEISWTKVKHPSQKFSIGDVIKVKVLGLDTAERRISLSTRALEQNPFEAVAEKFPVGTVVKAKIKSLADFGAFVELADGIDGLIHIGEISWTEHPNHPSELLNIAQEVEAVVVNVDVAKQRVGLSIKRTSANPYDGWEKKYRKGARLKLKVVRVDDKGAWLGVEDGITCFCFVRDLVGKEGDGRVERAQDAVKVGSEIEVEVKSFDRRFKKVSVSARAVIEGDTREAYQDYKKKEAAEGQKLNPLADKLKGISVAPKKG
ncbi:MAG: S1 RNA-binding domain-containing protein [Deltaproteobacteria bacterium]|nr:S1 RNA-binding domain-containing protein [Deltaproteobacteria bacterium]